MSVIGRCRSDVDPAGPFDHAFPLGGLRKRAPAGLPGLNQIHRRTVDFRRACFSRQKKQSQSNVSVRFFPQDQLQLRNETSIVVRGANERRFRPKVGRRRGKQAGLNVPKAGIVRIFIGRS